MTKRYCTVPKIGNLRNWYEKNFSDLCKTHDEDYQARRGYQWARDYDLAKGIWKRGKPLTAVGTFLLTASLGWLYWYDILGD